MRSEDVKIDTEFGLTAGLEISEKGPLRFSVGAFFVDFWVQFVRMDNAK